MANRAHRPPSTAPPPPPASGHFCALLMSASSESLCTLGFHATVPLLILSPTPAVLSHFSHVPLSLTLWTVAHPAPLSMGLSRQEYWSGLPCPSPGDLPDPGIKQASLTPNLHQQMGSLPGAPPRKPNMLFYFSFFFFFV